MYKWHGVHYNTTPVSLHLDELIRQETINCPERGLLLVYIRDEIQMSLASHKTLCSSSIAFGMRETLLAEHGKADMEKRVKQLLLNDYLITLVTGPLKYNFSHFLRL